MFIPLRTYPHMCVDFWKKFFGNWANHIARSDNHWDFLGSLLRSLTSFLQLTHAVGVMPPICKPLIRLCVSVGPMICASSHMCGFSRPIEICPFFFKIIWLVHFFLKIETENFSCQRGKHGWECQGWPRRAVLAFWRLCGLLRFVLSLNIIDKHFFLVFAVLPALFTLFLHFLEHK